MYVLPIRPAEISLFTFMDYHVQPLLFQTYDLLYKQMPIKHGYSQNHSKIYKHQSRGKKLCFLCKTILRFTNVALSQHSCHRNCIYGDNRLVLSVGLPHTV